MAYNGKVERRRREAEAQTPTMTEPFDAVLAEMRELADRTADYGLQGLTGKARLDSIANRLAAAHNEELRSAAAEVAERDAELARRTSHVIVFGATALACSKMVKYAWDLLLARAEAAEARVRELEDLLKRCVPYVNDGGHRQYAIGCSVNGDEDFAFAKHIESFLSQRS